jgi:putative PIG3 family NAD(P)H quinone oxidoreductase
VRAVVLESHGGPDVLQVRDVPDPVPGPEEVLVGVRATALNRADTLQRRGAYPGPPMANEIPGLEFSGPVVAVGERVTSLTVGAEVMGIVGGGAYAERLVTHERMAMRVPSNVPVEDGAAIPEVFLTAYDALVVQGGLTSGRWALVHAGASGVGTAAIQIVKALGARIVVTASAGKLDACRALGADVAVDYRADDFAKAVGEATDGHGVDVVLDVIGGEYLDGNVDSVRVGGRIIQVGVMGEAVASFALAKLLPKRAALIGTVLRARPVEEKIALTQRFSAELLPRFEDGSLRPVIDSRYALADIADAHRHMEANANVGKILIDV